MACPFSGPFSTNSCTKWKLELLVFEYRPGETAVSRENHSIVRRTTQKHTQLTCGYVACWMRM